MKIVIISQKFSVGHVSHLEAFFALFSNLQYETKFYIDLKYKEFLQEDADDKFIENIFDLSLFKPDFALFYSPSTRNTSAIKLLKKCNTKSVYVYHEPYCGVKELVKEGKKFLKFLLASVYQCKFIAKCDLILLCSQNAIQKYKKYYVHINSNYKYFPLIFQDEVSTIDYEKEYFSYIGGAVDAHGFIEFINFIKTCYLSKSTLPFRFLIVTRTHLKKYIHNNDILLKMQNENYLEIIEGRSVSTNEINRYYEKSFAVWNAYNRSTQSGVLIKALMFGAIPVGSNIDACTEVIKAKYNGMLIQNNRSQKEILDALLYIWNNKNEMSKNCKMMFREKYDYLSQIDAMRNILKSLE